MQKPKISRFWAIWHTLHWLHYRGSWSKGIKLSCSPCPPPIYPIIGARSPGANPFTITLGQGSMTLARVHHVIGHDPGSSALAQGHQGKSMNLRYISFGEGCTIISCLFCTNPYIFPTNCPFVVHSLKKAEIFDWLTSMYITYNSVSISTPWAVASPTGQLTSEKFHRSFGCSVVKL